MTRGAGIGWGRLWLAAAVLLAGCGGSSGKEKSNGTVPAAVAERRDEARCQPARNRTLRGKPDGSSYRGRGQAKDGVVAVTAGDFFFAPTCMTGFGPTPQQKGKDPVMLNIRNDSKTLHNVTIPVLKIDKDIPPGQTVSVPLRVAGPDLTYFCKFHRDSGMLGLLVP